MTGIQDDLDTLRSHAAETSRSVYWERIRAIDRIEAKIATLHIVLRAAYLYYPIGTPMSDSMRDALAAYESDVREPDDYRIDGGRVIPTDR